MSIRTKRLSNGMGTLSINTEMGEDLVKALSKQFVTRIGILGSKSNRMATTSHTTKSGRTVNRVSKTEESGQTNAEIGLKHEKGSYSERIPRRSFLEVPLVNNLSKVDAMGKKLNASFKTIDTGVRPEVAWRKAFTLLGIFAESIVQKAFEQSGPGWKPNAPMTIALKGSDRPLIDTAQLRKSVTSEVLLKS